jgi:5-histidylcysteine sulfoxide synthase/putative 4-mercaptohistidine N1-methyltranferase
MLTSIFCRTPQLNTGDEIRKRQEILHYFHSTFDRYELLFETLANEAAWHQKPIPLRHPLIFYYGHTASFFINKMLLAGLIKDRIDPALESMFAIGVDEMSWDDLNDAHYNWPDIADVQAYRNRVRTLVDNVIQTTPLTLPINFEHPWWTILMGVEHERIHLETSSVLIRQQRLDLVKPHQAFTPCRHSLAAPRNHFITVPAGKVVLGKNWDDRFYGWDNEYGSQQHHVNEFQASIYLCSNQEFLEFVNANGYHIDSYWDEEGLAWKNYTKAEHPVFWLGNGENWKLRIMLEVINMPWDWPVEVNYLEASAYCRWKSQQTNLNVQLPTEAQWYRLYEVARVGEIDSERQFAANIHLDHYCSPCPVNEFPHGQFYDVVGNVWQWTQTPMHPLPGFKEHPCYDDFTVPTFDGKHNLIKGGSWIACGNETLKSARYAFRRHFFQHAGFRYCLVDSPDGAISSNYETDKLLSEYAEFHYGSEYLGVPNFPKNVAALAIKAMANRPKAKALDLGCAVGRSSFELARHFDSVTGIDFSARFIGLAEQLANCETLRYTSVDEGDLVHYRECSLANLGLAECCHKVNFVQGDACNLKSIYSEYDLVLAANLIDRLYSPRKFINNVHNLVNVGGMLVITSPYTWLESHTPREEWLGGFKRDGENITTLRELNTLLSPHFRLLQEPVQIPFVIRETSRKFQHSLAELSIWERIA